MKKIVKIIFSLILTLSLTVILLVNNGFKSIKVNNLSVFTPKYDSWDEIFIEPINMNVHTNVSGELTGNKLIVLDQESSSINIVDSNKPTVIMTSLIEHPIYGNILVDTGLSSAFIKSIRGNYSFIQYLLVKSVAETKSKINPLNILENLYSNIDLVILTHTHGDHTSGLAELQNSIPIILNNEEINFMNKAMTLNHFKGKTNVKTFTFKKGKSIYPFDNVVDIYGDNSIFLINTKGHSSGHISILVNNYDRPILLTGDAIAYNIQIKHLIGPNKMMGEDAKKSFDQIIKFIKLYPQVKVITGHDIPEL